MTGLERTILPASSTRRTSPPPSRRTTARARASARSLVSARTTARLSPSRRTSQPPDAFFLISRLAAIRCLSCKLTVRHLRSNSGRPNAPTRLVELRAWHWSQISLGNPERWMPQWVRRGVEEPKLICLQTGVDVRLPCGKRSLRPGEQRDGDCAVRMLVDGVHQMVVLCAETAPEHDERQLCGSEPAKRVSQIDVAIDGAELVASGALGDK